MIAKELFNQFCKRCANASFLPVISLFIRFLPDVSYLANINPLILGTFYVINDLGPIKYFRSSFFLATSSSSSVILLTSKFLLGLVNLKTGFILKISVFASVNDLDLDISLGKRS